MRTTQKPRINPLSRMPRQQRLVMAVRGGGGVGKSHFISSMANAGLGRLCIFDTERKTRLLRGVGVSFDALEIEQPDELPEFVDWALFGEGQAQSYGCYALDSWAAYYNAKHGEMLQAVRDAAGDPLAQPNSEQLSSDQMVLQTVLRRLCIESGKCIVIADQIVAQGKENRDDSGTERVLPMTASGLEYFVDVMVEISLQEREGEIVRVFQVVKSNSPAFEVGFEMTGNVTFKDFLDRMRTAQELDITFDEPEESPVPLYIEYPAPIIPPSAQQLIDELIVRAEANGLKRADIVTSARIFHKQSNIYHLTVEQVEDLDRRVTERIEKRQAAQPAAPTNNAAKTSGKARKADSAESNGGEHDAATDQENSENLTFA